MRERSHLIDLPAGCGRVAPLPPPLLHGITRMDDDDDADVTGLILEATQEVVVGHLDALTVDDEPRLQAVFLAEVDGVLDADDIGQVALLLDLDLTAVGGTEDQDDETDDGDDARDQQHPVLDVEPEAVVVDRGSVVVGGDGMVGHGFPLAGPIDETIAKNLLVRQPSQGNG